MKDSFLGAAAARPHRFCSGSMGNPTVIRAANHTRLSTSDAHYDPRRSHEIHEGAKLERTVAKLEQKKGLIALHATPCVELLIIV